MQIYSYTSVTVPTTSPLPHPTPTLSSCCRLWSHSRGPGASEPTSPSLRGAVAPPLKCGLGFMAELPPYWLPSGEVLLILLSPSPLLSELSGLFWSMETLHRLRRPLYSPAEIGFSRTLPWPFTGVPPNFAQVLVAKPSSDWL